MRRSVKARSKSAPKREASDFHPSKAIGLPLRQSALQERYPRLAVPRVVLQSDGLHSGSYQTANFCGGRSDLAFVPDEAFTCTDWCYIDEFGDQWHTRYGENGIWFVIWHCDENGTDIPRRGRKWPQKGLSMQVSRMLRVIAKRSKAVRT